MKENDWIEGKRVKRCGAAMSQPLYERTWFHYPLGGLWDL